MGTMAVHGPVGTVTFNVDGPGDASSAPNGPAEDGGSLMPAPMQQLALSSDVGAQIAALVLEIGHEQKQAARMSRRAAEAAQEAQEKKELDALRDEADAKLAAGLVGAGVEMMGGAMQLSAVNGSASKQLGAKASAEIFGAVGKVDTALLNHDADLYGIEAKQAGNAASKQKTAVDDARDQLKDAKETIDKALDLYKEYQTAKADAQKAVFSRA